MKHLLVIILTILMLCTATVSFAAHSVGNIVQFETINGRQYKVIHHLTEDEVIIYYFDSGDIPQGKYKLSGVEIFKGGKIIKDTFEGND